MVKYLILSALMLVSVAGWAQGGTGDPTGNGGDPSVGPSPNSPTAVPLDGGAALLLASGIGYGIRRLRQRKMAS